MKKLRLGVLISGRGSNLQALIDACAAPDYPAEIALVISNRPGAQGLEHAATAGIEHRVIDHESFPGREPFDEAMDEALRAAGVELVCLAGFMRLLSDPFVAAWLDGMINVHPALLPSFKGADGVAQALAAGVRITGCSVHFIRSEMDVGPIIVQAAVPVLPGDDEDKLSARIREAEHRCYPLAVRLIAEGRVTVKDERVEIDGALAPDGAMINPRPE